MRVREKGRQKSVEGRGRKEVENLVPDWQEEVEHEAVGELHMQDSQLDNRVETLYSYTWLSRHLPNIPGGSVRAESPST
jgi:hypothetical protein